MESIVFITLAIKHHWFLGDMHVFLMSNEEFVTNEPPTKQLDTRGVSETELQSPVLQQVVVEMLLVVD